VYPDGPTAPREPETRFPEGKLVMFYEFKSTANQRDRVRQYQGPWTLFTIEVQEGYAIGKFSAFPLEAEVLLPPLGIMEANSPSIVGTLTEPDQVFLRHIVTPRIKNIVVWGQAGMGKSSLVNAILNYKTGVPFKAQRGTFLAGFEKYAEVRDSAQGVTFQCQPYHIKDLDGAQLRVCDSAGLNEAAGGTVDHKQAIKELFRLLRALQEGVSLLVMVMSTQGRISEVDQKNYKLMKAICGNVPFVLVYNKIAAGRPSLAEHMMREIPAFRNAGLDFDRYECVRLNFDHLCDPDMVDELGPMTKGDLKESYTHTVPSLIEMAGEPVVPKILKRGYVRGALKAVEIALKMFGVELQGTLKFLWSTFPVLFPTEESLISIIMEHCPDYDVTTLRDVYQESV